MELVKVESLEKAVKTPNFIKLIPQVVQYGLLNLVKPYQNITIITLMIYGLYCKAKGVFYPTPNTEVPFTKGKL